MGLFVAIKVLYKDKLAAWLINISILAILATWILFLFKRIVQSPIAVLHFNIYSGIDVVGMWYWLFIIPGIVLVISFLDFLLAIFFWTKQRIWSYFLLTIILIANIITFLFLFNILNYNL